MALELANPKRRITITEQMISDAQSLARRGLSLTLIAAKLNVCFNTLSRWMSIAQTDVESDEARLANTIIKARAELAGEMMGAIQDVALGEGEKKDWKAAMAVLRILGAGDGEARTTQEHRNLMDMLKIQKAEKENMAMELQLHQGLETEQGVRDKALEMLRRHRQAAEERGLSTAKLLKKAEVKVIDVEE